MPDRPVRGRTGWLGAARPRSRGTGAPPQAHLGQARGPRRGGTQCFEPPTPHAARLGLFRKMRASRPGSWGRWGGQGGQVEHPSYWPCDVGRRLASEAKVGRIADQHAPLSCRDRRRSEQWRMLCGNLSPRCGCRPATGPRDRSQGGQQACQHLLKPVCRRLRAVRIRSPKPVPPHAKRRSRVPRSATVGIPVHFLRWSVSRCAIATRRLPYGKTSAAPLVHIRQCDAVC